MAVFGLVTLTAQTVNAPKAVIQTDQAPKAIGPYSQAITAGGFVYCSGQLAIDPATGKLVTGGIEEQTRQVLKNLQVILEAAGSSLDRVVKCTVMLADMGEFAAMNKVYAEFFKTAPPARATFQVARLALDAKIEIDCIAVKR
ncbi:MAG: RidA family protein [Candidatus Aminicenantes bacterium]|nr:RidA family protein [Candidatus Aminicenantes bacterium]